MAELVQMFLFLYKSKYRRKQLSHYDNKLKYNIIFPLLWAIILWILLLGSITTASSSSAPEPSSSPGCTLDNCLNGDCINGSCVCHDGWQGTACQYCSGKIKYLLFFYS